MTISRVAGLVGLAVGSLALAAGLAAGASFASALLVVALLATPMAVGIVLWLAVRRRRGDAFPGGTPIRW
ncbi:MAG: hypothetical protein R3C39_13765 [Dehalococcoidia bacterium]